jgi:hypothetical protein
MQKALMPSVDGTQDEISRAHKRNGPIFGGPSTRAIFERRGDNRDECGLVQTVSDDKAQPIKLGLDKVPTLVETAKNWPGATVPMAIVTAKRISDAGIRGLCHSLSRVESHQRDGLLPFANCGQAVTYSKIKT